MHCMCEQSRNSVQRQEEKSQETLTLCSEPQTHSSSPARPLPFPAHHRPLHRTCTTAASHGDHHTGALLRSPPRRPRALPPPPLPPRTRRSRCPRSRCRATRARTRFHRARRRRAPHAAPPHTLSPDHLCTTSAFLHLPLPHPHDHRPHIRSPLGATRSCRGRRSMACLANVPEGSVIRSRLEHSPSSGRGRSPIGIFVLTAERSWFARPGRQHSGRVERGRQGEDGGVRPPAQAKSPQSGQA